MLTSHAHYNPRDVSCELQFIADEIDRLEYALRKIRRDQGGRFAREQVSGRVRARRRQRVRGAERKAKGEKRPAGPVRSRRRKHLEALAARRREKRKKRKDKMAEARGLLDYLAEETEILTRAVARYGG